MQQLLSSLRFLEDYLYCKIIILISDLINNVSNLISSSKHNIMRICVQLVDVMILDSPQEGSKTA